MPFVLHPSGYCVWFNQSSGANLITGVKCPECKRTAGHKYTCTQFKESETGGRSSRPKLYNSTAVLWARDHDIKFFTFTLPSRPGHKTYQIDPHCKDTGDLQVTATFSKLLESVAVRIKREAPPNGRTKFSYVWVAEAQMARQEKFGGIGDLHFHLVTNAYIDIRWIQALWSSYFPDPENRNSVHLEPIPTNVRSIPAYLCKYLGKGSNRQIFSRRFGCSRDLSALEPIHIQYLPAAIQPITQKIVTQPNGYESCLYYFNTAETLEIYSRYMIDEKNFKGTRQGQNFTPSAIASRAFKRERVQTAKAYRQKHGIIEFPGTVGSSYST